MQNNHIYVEDNGEGRVTVYDDQGRLKPEKKFHYGESNGRSRAEARALAEAQATSLSIRLKCGWGCNYEGGKGR